MAKFDPVNLAVQTICPNNLVKTDDTGLPSVLVFIPKFKNSDVLTGGDDSTHPAFIVNGTEIAGFYYSKYQNVVHNGAAYSLPAQHPQTWYGFDQAMNSCGAKGNGWHLSTAAEWAAIALWCKKNGFLPYGNNNYGKDSRESNYKAIPVYYNADGTIGRVATGTGPLEWSHDKSLAGIWDMNGNVWEWQGGLRVVWGELQILANNDAADPDNPQNETSTCWKAINAADGSLVEPESKTTDTAVKTSGSTVKLDFVSNVWTYSTGITNASTTTRPCAFNSITCTDAIGDAAKALLRALALLPDTGENAEGYEGDYMWCKNSEKERSISRGGHWVDGEHCGIFGIYAIHNRSESAGNIGFRSAYIPELDQ